MFTVFTLNFFLSSTVCPSKEKNPAYFQTLQSSYLGPSNDKGFHSFILQIIIEHSVITVPGTGRDEGMKENLWALENTV